MMDVPLGAEEHQVTWLKRRSGRQRRTGVVLGLGCPWNIDTGGGVRSVSEAGAVESRVTVTAPHVRLADLRAGKLYRHQRGTTEVISSGLNC